jgi:hypothetical protein
MNRAATDSQLAGKLVMLVRDGAKVSSIDTPRVALLLVALDGSSNLRVGAQQPSNYKDLEFYRW